MSDGTTNPLSMSDEDFLNMPEPPREAVAEPVVEAEAVVEAPVVETTGVDPVVEAEVIPPVVTEEEAPALTDAEVEAEAAAKLAGQTAPAGTEGDGGVKPAGTEGAQGGAATEETEEQKAAKAAEAAKTEGAVPSVGSAIAPPTPEEAQAFYQKIMAPFPANGKTVELKSPEEVIQLMQQGANYTRKMQAIAPHRKMLTMAQNNGITEDKLSFLIDLEKGDPAAIQKFLKDKGVDPLTIDTESEPTYREGTHKVSDNEVAFNTHLEELSSTPEGKETLQTINSTWDDASKEVLWGEPSLMPVIHAQKASGVYALISSEVDRRKLLGQIAPETSFIDAYRAVGDDMVRQQQAQAPAPVITPPVVKPEPVATTVVAPKAVVGNGDKASAASPTRSTPKPAKAFVNPLAMSDAEFEAQFASMQGRV